MNNKDYITREMTEATKQYIFNKIINKEELSYDESQFFMKTDEGQACLYEVINKTNV